MTALDSAQRAITLLGDAASAYSIARSLGEQEYWPRERMQELQQNRLTRLVRHAAGASPFYKQHLADIDLSRPIELKALPTVDKRTIMASFDEVVTDRRVQLADIEREMSVHRGGYYLKRYRIHASSGSSGQKGVWLWDHSERAAAMAATMRLRVMLGFPWGPWNRHRVTEITYPRGLDRTVRWGLTLDLRLKRRQILDPLDRLSSLVGCLNNFAPDHLIGLGSQLGLLAAEQLDGRLRIRPRSVTSWQDLCTAEIKQRIKSAWGITPFEIYGMSESGGLLAVDCEHHAGLHLLESLNIVEVVDGENQAVANGVTGSKILLTNLSSYAQPRIRYEIPDMVRLAPNGAECPCGRTTPLIEVVEGRSDDAISLPGRHGGEVALNCLHFRQRISTVDGVKEHQVRYDGQRFRIAVVLRDGARAEDVLPIVHERLLRTLEPLDVLIPPLEVEQVAEDRIERDPRHRGKFKVLIDERRISAVH
jgi:phenylacetate-coenzyme A ligase PaaK-like adenylate-forming protein